MSKKKSEYQKVLDLLNEYEDPMVSWYEEYDEETGFFILNRGQKAYEEVIVGKTYGFIKWLVENEKIDLETALIGLESNDRTSYTETEELLMLLAIEDEPIKFLCEILK